MTSLVGARIVRRARRRARRRRSAWHPAHSTQPLQFRQPIRDTPRSRRWHEPAEDASRPDDNDAQRDGRAADDRRRADDAEAAEHPRRTDDARRANRTAAPTTPAEPATPRRRSHPPIRRPLRSATAAERRTRDSLAAAA